MLIQMNTAPANKPLELEAAMSQARDFLASIEVHRVEGSKNL